MMLCGARCRKHEGALRQKLFSKGFHMLGIVPKSTLEGIKAIICCQECVRLMCNRFLSDFSRNGRFEIGLFSLFLGGMNGDKRGTNCLRQS